MPMMTRAIIAGGRDLPGLDIYYNYLQELHTRLNIVEVISGCARGGDHIGEMFAAKNNIPVSKFPAQWKLHGKMAGPIRNREMAEYIKRLEAGCVILLPGGKGTANMEQYANFFNIQVYKYV